MADEKRSGFHHARLYISAMSAIYRDVVTSACYSSTAAEIVREQVSARHRIRRRSITHTVLLRTNVVNDRV